MEAKEESNNLNSHINKIERKQIERKRKEESSLRIHSTLLIFK